ncbi:signal peptidase II [Actinomyces vulturis]|uniref:signal peptidase II n=1 Tax=Actinomyces vulturis TaxID=1857645 RepID=UPI00082ED161|nr:signal peptidase II [Actinomyces vulturis]
MAQRADTKAPRSTALTMWGVAFAVLVADQLSKMWALSALADGHEQPLIGHFLTLVLVHNPGAAFSFATSATWIFTLLATAVVIAIAVLTPRVHHIPWAWVLGLTAGGAAGNLIDRLIREPGFGQGHVVDFINYDGHFVGNVADIAIVFAAIGVAWLTLTNVGFDGKPVTDTQKTTTEKTEDAPE